MRNIETKLVRPRELNLVGLLNKAGAESHWTRMQRDTFWNVAHGWLKLREVIGVEPKVNAELIGYQRSTETGDPRPSDYHLVPIPDPDSLKRALDATLGRRGVVEKQRQLWIWKQTRIHIDEIHQLGSFLELETVLKGIDEVEGQDQMQEALRMLKLESAERISVPYLELLDRPSPDTRVVN